MISAPAKFIKSALDGVSAWAFNVLPSVLPFMFFTKVLSSLNVMPKLTAPFSAVSETLFKTPPISIYAFTMAVLSGYPVGSKMVADLYVTRQITQEDAFKMSAFCSTSGPMFIVGAVGVGMFHSARLGYILFLSHLFGAALNGIMFRNLKIKAEEQNSQTAKTELPNTPAPKAEQSNRQATKAEQPQKFNLADVVTNSTLSILSVGCIITIFFIVIECFSPIFSLFPASVSAFLEGLVEITRGALSLSKLGNLHLAVAMCSFVVSFGGISTILQSLTMLKSVNMPVKLFVFQKFMHAVFSTAITLILLAF